MPAVLAPPVRGPAESQQRDKADCGTLAADAIVRLFAPDASLPTLDNATAAQVTQAINALGIPGLHAVDEYPRDLRQYLSESIVHGDYVMAGIRVNSSTCLPTVTGDAEHWVSIYSDDGHYYNCWFATYEGPEDLQAAYLASVVFVGCVRISYRPTTEPPTKSLEELIAMLEPICVATESGTFFLNERGDYGIPGMPSPGDRAPFPTVVTTADGYNHIVRARAAAWAEYLAALRNQPAPAGLTPVRAVASELPSGMRPAEHAPAAPRG